MLSRAETVRFTPSAGPLRAAISGRWSRISSGRGPSGPGSTPVRTAMSALVLRPPSSTSSGTADSIGTAPTCGGSLVESWPPVMIRTLALLQ
jgi:hypothetical protein